MKHKIQYVRLVLAILSFVFLLIVSITSLYAWFTSGNSATIKGIDAKSESEDFDIVLYKELNGVYQSNDLSIGLLNPGDFVYYKAQIKNNESKDLNFNLFFDGISSTLMEDELFYKDNAIYQSYTINNQKSSYKLYDLVNNQYVVNDKVCYLYEDNTLKLQDYLIEDEIYFILKENDTFNLENKKSIKDMLLSNEEINHNETKEYEFALYYDIDATKEYQFQNITINSLFIKKVGE